MVPSSRYLEAPQRLRAFVRAHETSLAILAALIGVIGGLVVAAMSAAVSVLHAVLFNLGMGAAPFQPVLDRSAARHAGSDLWRAAAGRRLPVAAALAAGREIDPIEANALHGGRMSFRGSLIVALQTVWSSGVGASVGLEAGYTQLASGIAASIGRGFHLRRADQRVMVGCGAAAAIAGAFGAPLAGAFYAFELVIGGYTSASLAPVGVAAVTGYFVAHAFRRCRSASLSAGSATCSVTILPSRRCSAFFAAPFGIAHHARRRAVRGAADQNPVVAAAASGAGRPAGRLAGAADAAGDVVRTWRAAFRRHVEPLPVDRGLVRAEIARLDRLARHRFSWRVVFCHAVSRRARRPSVRRRLQRDLAGLTLDPDVYAIIGMSALSASVIGGPLTMSFIALESTGNLWLTTACWSPSSSPPR